MPLDSLAGYRRTVGHYNAKPRQPCEKSIVKALKKARNSHDCPRSQRTNSKSSSSKTHQFSTIVKVALVASIVAATIPSTGAMTNGISREGNANATALFPRLLTPNSACSATRITPNKVLTAKHCTPNKENVHAKDEAGNWMQSTSSWDLGSAGPNLISDLAIHSFPRNLKGKMFCVPIMRQNIYQMLKEAPANICGLNGRFLLLGYGQGERLGTANSAVFNPISSSARGASAKTSPMEGAPFNELNEKAWTGSGDSGAGVLGCNPSTGKYELVGTFVQSGFLKKKDGTIARQWSNFVNFPENNDVRNWINRNRGLCPDANIDPNDIYDTSVRNNGEKHELDRCKLPTKYFYKVGMSKDEIIDCYEKIRDPRTNANCFNIKALTPNEYTTSGTYIYKASNICNHKYTLSLYDNEETTFFVDLPPRSAKLFKTPHGRQLKTDVSLYWGLSRNEPHSFRIPHFFQQKMVFLESDITRSPEPKLKPSRAHMGKAECLYLNIKQEQNLMDVGNWCAPSPKVSFKLITKTGVQISFRGVEHNRNYFNIPFNGEIDTEAGLWFSSVGSYFNFEHFPNYFKEPPPQDLRGSASCVNIYETKTRDNTTDLVQTQGHVENNCDRNVVINFQETGTRGYVSTVTVEPQKKSTFPVNGELDRSKGARVNFVGDASFIDFSHYLNQHPAPIDPPSKSSNPPAPLSSPALLSTDNKTTAFGLLGALVGITATAGIAMTACKKKKPNINFERESVYNPVEHEDLEDIHVELNPLSFSTSLATNAKPSVDLRISVCSDSNTFTT